MNGRCGRIEHKIIDKLDDEKVKAFTHRLDITEDEYLIYDCSKTHLTLELEENYKKKLESQGLSQRIDKLLEGGLVNYTEKRPVLHHLLRDTEILNKIEAYVDSFNKLNKQSPIKSPSDTLMISVDGNNKCCQPCKDGSCPCSTSGLGCDNTRCSKGCECTMENSKKKFNSSLRCEINDTTKESDLISTDKASLLFETARSGNSVIDEAKIEIFEELIKIHDFCQQVKFMKGVTGKPIDTIVSIGIGGSDLGPRMVASALQMYEERYKVYFISNIDSTDTFQVFSKINPATSLFIIVSKTFTTMETIENYKLARLLFDECISKQNSSSGGLSEEEANKQFVAVTSNVDEAKKYGISQVFKMWDFVGGRYSLWSAAGLSIALYIGFGNYLKLLRGASIADKNFFTERSNSISARLATNELFYIDHGYNNKCLVAYDGYLGLLYKYLQQVEMESNGKAGSRQMIIWGGVGTDVQHSFFQLLHQGEQNILTEFLLPIKNLHLATKVCCSKKCGKTCCDEQCESNCDCPETKERAGTSQCGSPCDKHCQKSSSLRCYSMPSKVKESILYHHQLLASNCLAQSRSLMVGRCTNDSSRNIRGDKPSTTILYSFLSPAILGAILAIYEHKIFIEGVFFGINSFDQFGVQLGKDIALELYPSLNGDEKSFDSSTQFLIGELKK